MYGFHCLGIVAPTIVKLAWWLGGDPRPGTNGWNAPFAVARPWLMAYQNETRLVGRPDVPVVITETGWSRDFCTEVERAGWQVSAWQAWNADPQVRHATGACTIPRTHAHSHTATHEHAESRSRLIATCLICHMDWFVSSSIFEI